MKFSSLSISIDTLTDITLLLKLANSVNLACNNKINSFGEAKNNSPNSPINLPNAEMKTFDTAFIAYQIMGFD